MSQVLLDLPILRKYYTGANGREGYIRAALNEDELLPFDGSDKGEYTRARPTRFHLWFGMIGTTLALFMIISTIYLSIDPQNIGIDFAAHTAGTNADSPFSGAFATIGPMKSMDKTDKRMTLIGMWNKDDNPEYLRHFFYSTQLNADAVDLVFIDRKFSEADKCIDFEAEEIDIAWGGNIKVICMGLEEWRKRHVNFLCSQEHGWNCSPAEEEMVRLQFETIDDAPNFNWRLFRGWVFRDLLPDNPYWAWIDHDLSVGRLTHFPFNILSSVSMVSFLFDSVLQPYLTGQLTVFNFRDPFLSSVWKMIPELASPEIFRKGLMPQAAEEQLWSWSYLGSDDGQPGSNLSYAIFPDLNGDDEYANENQVYAISGRDVILMEHPDRELSRGEIEEIVRLERAAPIDDLGGVGWTSGFDGSDLLMTDPSLKDTTTPAFKEKAALATSSGGKDVTPFEGILETTEYLHGEKCPKTFVNVNWRNCLAPHKLADGWTTAMRASIIRLRGQLPGFVFRRLEKDRRPRIYSRKLFKHHHWSKHWEWLNFPSFDITEEHVFLLGSKKAEVFRMGADRETTIFYRDRQNSKKVG